MQLNEQKKRSKRRKKSYVLLLVAVLLQLTYANESVDVSKWTRLELETEVTNLNSYLDEDGVIINNLEDQLKLKDIALSNAEKIAKLQILEQQLELKKQRIKGSSRTLIWCGVTFLATVAGLIGIKVYVDKK